MNGWRVIWISLCSVACSLGWMRGEDAPEPFRLDRGDVVAFLGGENVAAMEQGGHLESLLAARFPRMDVKFRNLAWEADTVYAQPREVNFPPLTNLVRRARATVVVLGFGQPEALQGIARAKAFAEAYEKLLDAVDAPWRRLVVVTPVPFEAGPGLLPDLSPRNGDLAVYRDVIAGLARRPRCRVVDLFSELKRQAAHNGSLTSDGMHLTPRGQAVAAAAMFRLLGLEPAGKGMPSPGPKGEWQDAPYEELRLAVVAKNRLWFDSWRPMNWAFLGGDRTEQPSSRDHRDPKVRWFPEEMERFKPLIQQAEVRVEGLAAAITAAASK
jgi:hypothetical protein